MIELLTVQSALEDARAQNLLARTDWFLSLAQLAHDTGSLWIPEGTSIEQRYEKMKKDGQK
jgi:outer membrane protein TolC